jgi:hypothetical protein
MMRLMEYLPFLPMTSRPETETRRAPRRPGLISLEECASMAETLRRNASYVDKMPGAEVQEHANLVESLAAALRGAAAAYEKLAEL